MSAKRVVLLGLAVGIVACSGKTDRNCNEAVTDCSHAYGGSSGTGAAGGAASGGSGAVSTSPKPPEGPFPAPNVAAASCSAPGTVTDVFDLPGVRAWLVRSWFFCSGGSIFDSPHDGLEFAEDGHWYFLDLKLGKLVRREDFSGGGVWDLVDTSSMNGPGPNSVQLNIDSFQGGGIPAFVRFAVEPMKLNLSAYPGVPTEYVAANPTGPQAACAVCEHPWFTCGKPGWESVNFQMESQESSGCTGRIVMAGGSPSTELKIHCNPAAVCANELCSPTELTETSFTWNGASCGASK
ncbi:MAG: hypothetical protein IPI67_14280 [Myxococcales bacterium]|nr:hypothetical protein [Myxococcales bacterium]